VPARDRDAVGDEVDLDRRARTLGGQRDQRVGGGRQKLRAAARARGPAGGGDDGRVPRVASRVRRLPGQDRIDRRIDGDRQRLGAADV
jgi:hypothetical protein